MSKQLTEGLGMENLPEMAGKRFYAKNKRMFLAAYTEGDLRSLRNALLVLQLEVYEVSNRHQCADLKKAYENFLARANFLFEKPDGEQVSREVVR